MAHFLQCIRLNMDLLTGGMNKTERMVALHRKTQYVTFSGHDHERRSTKRWIVLQPPIVMYSHGQVIPVLNVKMLPVSDRGDRGDLR